MPGVESAKQDDAFVEPREGDREKSGDKDRSSKSKGAASSKTKDLSHVPCKFFRVGSCTAGASCPFSHSTLEPGQHKETCAWFIKGNCKFGHKCALAHILPGQNMSMDRKNKKAAQVAANQGNGSGRDNQRNSRSQKNASQGQAGGGGRNPLLSGSTAPTRNLSSSRSPIPMPLKATLSPSAPAPPVKDTDFPSFGDKLPSAPAQTKPHSSDASPPAEAEMAPEVPPESKPEPSQPESEHTPPTPLPMNKPSTARRNGMTHQGSPSISELGPIGSPPHNSPGHPSRINGFSPGTSPSNAPISNSPFSAPGTQTVFMLQQQLTASDDFKARSGLSASLGASMTWGAAERMQASKSRQSGGHSLTNEIVVEDEDLEEFIPGSLSDLLTPEERSRRFSRNASTRPNMTGVGDAAGLNAAGTESHHRYSRSVPAPSLLEDIRSIWATDGAAPGTPGTSVTGGGLGNGTPSSFQSNSGLPARVDEMLAPSNASAAFLPGLHHYISTKPPSRPPGMQNLYPQTATGTHTPVGNAYQAVAGGMAMSPPRLNSFAGRPAFEAAPSDSYLTSQARLGGMGRGGADGLAGEAERSGMSPSARALQAHAPGQSLPQGLAAGYSRIHALPPPVIPSPSTTAAFSPGRSGGFSPATKGYGHSSGPSGDWHSLSPNAGAQDMAPPPSQGAGGNVTTAPTVPPGLGGLETMFSRLSYSAAASASRPTAAPPGLGTRNPSGRGYSGQGPTSPLSGPVLTGDDDDVFSMDG